MTLTDREKAIVMAYELRETIDFMGILHTTKGLIAFEFGLNNLVKALLPDVNEEELKEILKDIKLFSDDYSKYIVELEKHPEVLDKSIHEMMEKKLKQSWRS